AAVLFWFLLRKALQSNGAIKWVSFALLILIPASGLFYFYQKATHYFAVEKMDWSSLEKQTARGEVYQHNPHYPLIEQGHYTHTHIAPNELRQAWLERSIIHPDSNDARGQILVGTLIR